LTVASNVLTFGQLGRFYVTYYATSTTDTVSALTLGAGVAFVNNGNYSGLVEGGTGTASTIEAFWMDVSSLTGATVTFNNTVVGGLTWDLVVSQVPGALALDVSKEDKILDDRVQILERKLAKFAAFFEDRRDMLVEDYVEQKEPGVMPSSTVCPMPIGTPVLSRTIRNWM